MTAEPWYADGLRFGCTQCGRCCGGAPGFVWVSETEIDALAARLGLERAAFVRRYTRTVYRRGVSLVEKPNYDCVFYDRQRGCTVYEDRPRQCRSWPFWRTNLRDADSWAEASADCPGMDQGERHDRTTIEAWLRDDGLV